MAGPCSEHLYTTNKHHVSDLASQLGEGVSDWYFVPTSSTVKENSLCNFSTHQGNLNFILLFMLDLVVLWPQYVGDVL